MPKFPDMVEINKEEKYQTQLKSYKQKMNLKIDETEKKEPKYDYFGYSSKDSFLFVISGITSDNLNGPGVNAKMDEKVSFLRKCICRQIDMSMGCFRLYPFQIFKMIYENHCYIKWK